MYYRLNTIHITIPSLRERREDIHLLFRKFTSDFADKYGIPPVRIEEDAIDALLKHPWPGNIRQLKNFAEQISAVEQKRSISLEKLMEYLPKINSNVPILFKDDLKENDFSEREILYKVLFDMKNDLNDLKKVTADLMNGNQPLSKESEAITQNLFEELDENPSILISPATHKQKESIMTLQDHERILIQKALQRHSGRRKDAADELGISERTLYRKIKEYRL